MANTALETGNAPIFRAGTSDAEIEAAAMKAMSRRKYVVLFWQVAILVAILGVWQLASDLHWIDPFFYYSPTASVSLLAATGWPPISCRSTSRRSIRSRASCWRRSS
jgi:hypothetical protein